MTEEVNFAYPIDGLGLYYFCVFGASAIKGGKGGKICGKHEFNEEQSIYMRFGTRDSGGLGGKCCGFNCGDGYNGAGYGMIQISEDYSIISGGGGGNSEGNNKGGDAEKDGNGDYGGKAASKYGPGKGGKGFLTKSEDGKQFKGGNGISSKSIGHYCGGGGGNGYYGGGSGGYGSSPWDGGGGGGSNYCKTNAGCDNYNINDLSVFAGVIVFKYE